MAEEKQQMRVSAWHNEAIRRFGSDMKQWRFVCPLCGHVAAVGDFEQYKDAGASPSSAYQECIGRYSGGPGGMHEGGFDADGNVKQPCNYAAYGLFKLSPCRVEAEDGTLVEAFAFAEVER